MLACYGMIHCTTMSDARHVAWKCKLSSNKLAPPLKYLPLTNEAFEQNVLRGHYQVCVWRYAHQSKPPGLSPFDNGWIYDEVLQQMIPKMVLEGVKMIPDELLGCMGCDCKSMMVIKLRYVVVPKMVCHVHLFVHVRVASSVVMRETHILIMTMKWKMMKMIMKMSNRTVKNIFTILMSICPHIVPHSGVHLCCDIL